MAKRFFYVSGGILMLALAYHFGATSAGAQVGGSGVVSAFSGGGAAVPMNGGAITTNGDFYVTADFVTWTKLSNIFTGPVTPVQQITFGALKAKYR